MAALGVLDDVEDAATDRVRAADDDRLRPIEIVPVLGVAEERGGGMGEFRVAAEFRGRNVGNAGAGGQHAALAPQVPLEAVLEEVPDALLGLGPRLRVALADMRRHQDAHAERIETVAVLLEDPGELRLRLRGLAAVAARGAEIAIAAPGDVDQGFGRTRARDPDLRMRLLGRARPRIDIAQG